MIVRNILDDKGHAVAKAKPGNMLAEAAQIMHKYNVGALVVTDDPDRVKTRAGVGIPCDSGGC